MTHRPYLPLALILATSCSSSPNGTDAAGIDVAIDAIDATDTVSSPDAADASRPTARGLFVPVSLNASGTTAAMQALALPDIDGIAVDIVWTDIAATAARTYDFTRLDAMLQLARAAGKGVELSVIGAGGTPSAWFDSTTRIHLQYTPHNGATNRCFDTITPPIWDANYLAAWDDMTSQLALHIASAGFSDTVVALRLTGLNASTAESHLPAQSPARLANPPACLTVDSVSVWQQAGYTPTKIQTAWTSMVNSWATHFPSTLLEYVTWPSEGTHFPPIDDTGVITPPSATVDQAQYDATVAVAAARLADHLIIGHWFLMTDTPADVATVGYANRYGLGTMWQTNLWWTAYENKTHGSVRGAAACGGALLSPVACTDALFLNELNTGLNPAQLMVPLPAGATRIIEVFIPDPTLFPNATHTVHVALTQ